jgi:hypothetical protein
VRVSEREREGGGETRERLLGIRGLVHNPKIENICYYFQIFSNRTLFVGPHTTPAHHTHTCCRLRCALEKIAMTVSSCPMYRCVCVYTNHTHTHTHNTQTHIHTYIYYMCVRECVCIYIYILHLCGRVCILRE